MMYSFVPKHKVKTANSLYYVRIKYFHATFRDNKYCAVKKQQRYFVPI